MSKHTPGPWKVELGRVSPDAPVFGFNITGGDNKWHGIAGCAVYEALNAECFTPAEMEANACLIAAAPELLAALKQVQDWLLETGQLEDDGITHPLMLKANNLAVAAIAKAEGV